MKQQMKMNSRLIDDEKGKNNKMSKTQCLRVVTLWYRVFSKQDVTYSQNRKLWH
jgi:hypothetical protein